MKKIYYLSTLVIVLLISFLGITYSFEYINNDSLTFQLIGDAIVHLDIYTEYSEYGVIVTYNN